VWSGSVYTLVCSPTPPPSPPPAVPDSPATDIWIPPGLWYQWNTSAALCSIVGPVVLKGLRYALGELPLFAMAGAVVPTQTIQRKNGPLVWIIFPGTGNGSNYEDDGVSTQYQEPAQSGISRTVLTHTLTTTTDAVSLAGGTTQHTIVISGQLATNPLRRQQLQLRRIVGSQGAPTSVTCDGAALPELPPPSAGTTLWENTGWWVTPAADDSLWLAGGSLMVSLPLSSSNVSTTIVY
jgi:hypothetical protein